MKANNSKSYIAVAAACLLLAPALSLRAADPTAVSVSAAQAAAAQVDSAGGVTVKVTPKSLAKDATIWEFAVSLNTHSVDLADDLVRSTVLIDGQGRRYVPVAWEGAGPGGHHRSGVLKFKPPVQPAGPIVLQMNGVGGIAERTFRWEIN